MMREFIVLTPNEIKMSDGGRGRASCGVKVWKSSHKWSAQQSAVRSIAFHEKASREKMKFISSFVSCFLVAVGIGLPCGLSLSVHV
jgi:hypothetical protein